MRLWHRITIGLVLLAVAATPGLAQLREATISLGRDPEPPYCVQNPGGTVEITWNIDHETTPNYVYYKLEDPTRTIILEQQTYPGNTGLNINRSWTVPNGLNDGKYWVRVEYWSFEAGNEANAEVTFYVCTDTGEICASKYRDANCNGELDGDDTPVADWWICLHTPEGDQYCRRTGADGRVCWDGVITGDYTVFEPPVAGWNPVGPTEYEFNLEPGGYYEAVFLNQRIDDCEGACCFDDGSCVILLEADCTAQGGEFLGAGTACDPNPCPQPPGACCFPDGSCQFVTEAECIGQQGDWLGYGTVCDPNPCPQPPGACCFDDGSCMVLLEAECLAAGGEWLGYGTDCDPNPCDQPQGACCFPDGSCQFVTEAVCLDLEGDWLGWDTNCEPNPCPQPPGACCFEDGSCVFLLEVECAGQGGQWLGYGTVCDPNPCVQPPGACCLIDGSCVYVPEAECQGDWLGYGTVCEPNPCPQPPGACCLISGECLVLTEEECAQIEDAVYYGDFVPCDPNPCPPPVPTREGTWGQIKNEYR